MDLSVFLTPEAWISLITLIFLEIILGVDNIVFIAITTNRLPEDKQHLGRKLGLAGALISRIVFLCFASFLVHMQDSLFTLDLGVYSHGFSVRDLVLLAGGAYLVYKGIDEVKNTLELTEERASHGHPEAREAKMIGLRQAIATIMVMDIVFSIDSVITAVGLASHLIVMIVAVMVAVIMMMVFIDQISNFINKHAEMKILAICFITVIGILLVLDSLGINSHIEVLGMHAEKLMVYFAMAFAFILELVQMRYNANLYTWKKECWKTDTACEIEKLKNEMMSQVAAFSEFANAHPQELSESVSLSDHAAHFDLKTMHAQESDLIITSTHKHEPLATPLFIDKASYLVVPLLGADAEELRTLLRENPQMAAHMNAPIEIKRED